MDFHNVNAIPHPSAQSGVLPQLRPVTPVEPVGKIQTEDANRTQQESRFTQSFPQTQLGELEFKVDENTDRLVVSIYNDSGEVVRQIPAEVVLKMAEQITEVLDAQKAPVTEVSREGGAA